MVNTEFARMQGALSYVPAHDRDTWLRMGMSIKSALGEDGFPLWSEWSQQDESYDANSARAAWKSIRPNGKITVATLFYEAKVNGWRDESAIRVPSADDVAARQLANAHRQQRDDAEIARQQAETANRATAIWTIATMAKADNPYLSRKNVLPVATLREIEAGKVAAVLGYSPTLKGAVLSGRLLVAPIKRAGQLSTLELIDGDGRKAALCGRGTRVGGCWATQVEAVTGDGTLVIGEGVATVLSATQATGHPGIAAFSDANLIAVAQAMRTQHPGADLIILADLVKATGAPNPKAVEAARCVGGRLAVPDFGAERTPNAKDFNDMAQTLGDEAVAAAIANSRLVEPPGIEKPRAVASGWAEPQPLTAKLEPEPYPIDALPATVRAAVEEVAEFVKAPTVLIASSALAAVSLAVQAHVDVKRAERLQGPTSLFLLTIADSGERKSTCDGFFMKPIRDHQQQRAEAMKPALARFEADILAWNAERDGLLAAIKIASRKGQDCTQFKVDLAVVQNRKPQAPRVPRLLLGDETPESLGFRLTTEWPSAGIVSAEAATVLGAHGMSKDSVMRNLGLYNVLWDGGEHSVGRRTSECYTIKGARLTVALQIQAAPLQSFIAKAGVLARGTGWFARFLIAWPQSTQGFRPFTEAPPHWPRLAAFRQRIEAILAKDVPIDAEGGLTPAVMTLAPDAKDAWTAFHDEIEKELASGGELHDVRDVASKTADNAARLAALFQVFEHGFGDTIGLDAFDGGSRIAAWHLYESRRFFGELALPPVLVDAHRIDSWVIDHCRREGAASVPKNHARQSGPIRVTRDLDAALAELVACSRVRLTKVGRTETIEVNPALLTVRL